MAADTDYLFTCDTYPVSYEALRNKAHGDAAVVGLLIAVVVLLFDRSGPTGSIVLVVVLVVIACWRAPRLFAFFREWLAQNGRVAASRPTMSPNHVALVLSASALAVVPRGQPYAICVALAALVAMTFRSIRHSTWSHRGFWALYRDVFVLYLCYPDDRYSGPCGAVGMWLPNVTLARRRHELTAYLSLGYAFPFVHAFRAIGAGGSGALALGAAASFLLPWLLPFAMFAPTLVSLMGSVRNAMPPGLAYWEQCRWRVANSTFHAFGTSMSEHLFLGFFPANADAAWHPFNKAVGEFDLPCRTPALFHRPQAAGHLHVLGGTRSGKTSIAVTGLLIQLIRGRSVPVLDVLGRPVTGLDGEPIRGRSEHVPILILDMKGDLALFNTVREVCAEEGQTFRHFTLESGKSTSYFNPISNLSPASRPVIEVCEMVLHMLDLWHGMFYGGSYYSERSRNALLKALKDAPAPPASWDELLALVEETVGRDQQKDVFELVGRIFALSQYPVLGPPPPGTHAIHMPDVVENCECVYMSLPALASAMSVVGIAKMAFFSFLDAAGRFNRSGRAIRECYLFLDEAQVVASKNLAILFQQASAGNVRMILSNQARSDLNTQDAPHLADTVWENTLTKQAFTIFSPEESKRWAEVSGEDLGTLTARSSGISQDAFGYTTVSDGVVRQDVVHKCLNQNVVNKVNNTQGGSLLLIGSGTGFSPADGKPREIWTPFPMSEADYRRRLTTPWPTAPVVQATTTSTTAVAAATVVNGKGSVEVDAEAKAKLEELFRRVSSRSGRHRPPPATH